MKIGCEKMSLVITLLIEYVFALRNKNILEIDCTKHKYAYFSTPDVLSMLVCYNGTQHIVECPPYQLYIPGFPHCTSAAKYKNNDDDLCAAITQRSKNIPNPWNCHGMLACANGRSRGNMQCALKYLVYNPYTDRCDYPSQYKCRQI